jgi:hypothetical protein
MRLAHLCSPNAGSPCKTELGLQEPEKTNAASRCYVSKLASLLEHSRRQFREALCMARVRARWHHLQLHRLCRPASRPNENWPPSFFQAKRQAAAGDYCCAHGLSDCLSGVHGAGVKPSLAPSDVDDGEGPHQSRQAWRREYFAPRFAFGPLGCTSANNRASLHICPSQILRSRHIRKALSGMCGQTLTNG